MKYISLALIFCFLKIYGIISPLSESELPAKNKKWAGQSLTLGVSKFGEYTEYANIVAYKFPSFAIKFKNI